MIASMILHQFRFGENSVDKFMAIAHSLGYPMFEWNGAIYKTPDHPVTWRQICENNYIGVYSAIIGGPIPDPKV